MATTVPLASPPTYQQEDREALVAQARRLREFADRLEARAASSADELVSAAIAHALSGDSLRARVFAARAESVAVGMPSALVGVTYARAIAWMCEGNCGAAFEALAALFGRQPDATACEAAARTAGLFAELALRTGRSLEARRVLDSWADSMSTHPRTEPEFEFSLLVLCQGDAISALLAAIAEDGRWAPLLTARLHLAVGMALRRSRRSRESRPHLMMAVDVIRDLGATPWLALAENELRAAGVRDGVRAPQVLSAQEGAIVDLAAHGLSNREIGERLHLSPRTVGSHLYRVFPKLGVTSRHQLSHAGAAGVGLSR
ncbi:hypothetical protein BH11ACT3_BH11ACT3_12850 [soil metagenome]